MPPSVPEFVSEKIRRFGALRLVRDGEWLRLCFGVGDVLEALFHVFAGDQTCADVAIDQSQVVENFVLDLGHRFHLLVESGCL